MKSLYFFTLLQILSLCPFILLISPYCALYPIPSHLPRNLNTVTYPFSSLFIQPFPFVGYFHCHLNRLRSLQSYKHHFPWGHTPLQLLLNSLLSFITKVEITTFPISFFLIPSQHTSVCLPAPSICGDQVTMGHQVTESNGCLTFSPHLAWSLQKNLTPRMVSSLKHVGFYDPPLLLVVLLHLWPFLSVSFAGSSSSTWPRWWSSWGFSPWAFCLMCNSSRHSHLCPWFGISPTCRWLTHFSL